MGTFRAFACPDGAALDLPDDLVLASWKRSGMAHQAALKRYLEDVRPKLPVMDPDVLQAIRLDVGLPESAALLSIRNLDNWLHPLTRRLDNGQITSAWATKRFAGRSRLWVEPAREVPAPVGGFRCRLSASYLTPGYREGIAKQLERAGATVVSPGEPLAVQICFQVGPTRNWLNLWRPTIDALASLLGEGATPWAPQDGRITSLGLHRHLGEGLWNEVLLDVVVTPASATVPTQALNRAPLATDGRIRLPVQR